MVYTSNAEITDDYYAVYRMPVVGGTTFVSRRQPGDTPPAVIRHHFSVERPIESAYLELARRQKSCIDFTCYRV